MPAEQQKISIEEALNNLHQQLVELRQLEKELEATAGQLNKELDNTDTMLLQHAEAWHKHREEYFNKLADQLAANGITLTSEEQTELRNGSSTISSIQAKLKILEKLQIALPDRMSDFTVIAYDAVVAALSRTLQKIDNQTIRSIAKKLTVIDEESKASSKVKSAHAEECEKIIATVKQLEARLNETPGLSPDKIHLLEQLEQQINTLSKSEEVKPSIA